MLMKHEVSWALVRSITKHLDVFSIIWQTFSVPVDFSWVSAGCRLHQGFPSPSVDRGCLRGRARQLLSRTRVPFPPSSLERKVNLPHPVAKKQGWKRCWNLSTGLGLSPPKASRAARSGEELKLPEPPVAWGHFTASC